MGAYADRTGSASRRTAQTERQGSQTEKGFITFAAISLVFPFSALARRETDETFFSHTPTNAPLPTPRPNESITYSLPPHPGPAVPQTRRVSVKPEGSPLP
jgi:hypothetical protein